MPIINFTQWQTATLAVPPWSQSEQLRKLTTGFQVYEQRPSPSRAMNLVALFNDWLEKWTPMEQARLLPAARNLAETINAMPKVPTQVAGGTQFQQVNEQQAGWTLITHARVKAGRFQADWGFNPAVAPIGPEVTGPRALPTLTNHQIAQITEAVTRCRVAATKARDDLIRLKGYVATGLGISGNLDIYQRYVRWFGELEKTRYEKVLANFTLLASSFTDMPPIVYDMRNYDFGRGCYAAVIPAQIAKNRYNRVTESVKMILGTAFFSAAKVKKSVRGFSPQRAFTKSSDATVGTLVHEFSHATWYAVDCPEIIRNPTGNKASDFKIGYNNDQTDIKYGSSNDNNIQTSTRRGDKLLARYHPDFAVINADNYGQFAVDAISPEEEDEPDLGGFFELMGM